MMIEDVIKKSILQSFDWQVGCFNWNEDFI